MEDELRRKFDELVARYELEPELRDIYVEGTTDKNLVQWFLRQKGQQDFVVYEIDTVDISAERLKELELSNNNRGRVIALALDMQSQLSALPPHLTCMADKDFDWLFGKEYNCDILLFTDYCSIELYFFNEIILDKFFSLAIGLSQIQAKEALDKLSKVLEDLFLIRATNEALGFNMEWLKEFGNCCKLTGAEIELQSETFIYKYLNKNSKLSQKQLFTDKLQELRTNKIAERRCKIRGHDFIELLCWYIKHYLAKNKRQFYDPEIVAVNLLMCIDAEHLGQETMFQRLLARLSEEQQHSS